MAVAPWTISMVTLAVLLLSSCRESSSESAGARASASRVEATETDGPCPGRRVSNHDVLFACSESGAPVDLLSQHNTIRFVFHTPTRVVQVEPEALEPKSIGGANDPHVLVCSLEGAGKRTTGYVRRTDLNRTPCSR